MKSDVLGNLSPPVGLLWFHIDHTWPQLVSGDEGELFLCRK